MANAGYHQRGHGMEALEGKAPFARFLMALAIASHLRQSASIATAKIETGTSKPLHQCLQQMRIWLLSQHLRCRLIVRQAWRHEKLRLSRTARWRSLTQTGICTITQPWSGAVCITLLLYARHQANEGSLLSMFILTL